MNTSEDIVELLMNDYLRVPTIILKMQPVLKNASAYVCLQFIWAKTGGWKNDKDTISYSQFKNDKRYGTGLSTKTIQRSVEKLAEIGVIIVKPSFNNMYEYSVNIDKIKQLVGVEAQSECPQAKTICPDLDETSLDNLSTSQVNLSTKSGQFVCESGQNDLHTNTSTLNLLHNTSTQDKKTEQKKSESKKPKTTAKKFNPLDYPIPDFVDKEIWIAYHDMRVAKRKPATEYACKKLIKSFNEWNNQGLNVNQAIEKSIIESWTDVYQNQAKPINQNNQGNNHAVNQGYSTTSNGPAKKSSADIYAENLARDLAERFPDEFPTYQQTTDC